MCEVYDAPSQMEDLSISKDVQSNLPTSSKHTHSQTSESDVEKSSLQLEPSCSLLTTSSTVLKESSEDTVLATERNEETKHIGIDMPSSQDSIEVAKKAEEPIADNVEVKTNVEEHEQATNERDDKPVADEGALDQQGTMEGPGEKVITRQYQEDSQDRDQDPHPDPSALSGVTKVDTSGKAHSDHFQSYSEWRQKVLEEEQKSKQDNTAVPNNQQTASKPKVRINLSSNTCGAKVLASNQEAENVQGVLTSNRDDYMLNPCSAPKKWFVIELCEPVQVKTIEIASLELFSSQPKTFRLLSSDRFPAKEWREKGEYEASEEKTAQVFQVDDQQFVKFLKVELLDHYGHEHFCPVTLFRVYGVPMADDDDDGEDSGGHNNEHPNAPHADDESALLQDGDESDVKENSRNLFMSAKDTVVNLVKKVLNVEETDRDTVTDYKTGAAEMLLNANYSTDGFLLPCVPESEDRDKKKEDEIVPTVAIPIPHTRTVKPIGKEKDVPIVTKLQDDEQIPSESDDEEKLVTLVASENTGPLEICAENAVNKTNHTTTSDHRMICSYVQTMLSNKIEQTCSVLTDIRTSSMKAIPSRDFTLIENSFIESSSSQSYSKKMLQESKVVSVSDSATRVVIEDTSEMVVTPHSATEQQWMNYESKNTQHKSGEEQPMQSGSSVHFPQGDDSVTSKLMDSITTTQQTQQQSQSDESSNLEPSISNHITETDTSLKQTPVLKTKEVPAEARESVVGEETLSIPRVSPSPASELSSSEGGLPTKVAATVSVNEEEEDEVEVISEFEGEQKENHEPEVVHQENKATADSNGTQDKGLDLVHVPLAPIAKRETAIMRLTNRIKALELNVSLSSRFLDELSHRFKKQSEDMMKLLNKTIAHFNNVTSRAEERDSVQQEQLDKLESRVENLTILMSELSVNMEELNSKITDRQLVWTTVEFILLLMVCVVCLRRGGSSSLHPEIRQLLEMMPRQPQLVHTRRNSVGTVGHVVPSTPIKKQASDSALAAAVCNDSSPVFEIVEQKNLLLTQQPTHKDGSKKKKKKKHKNLESKSSTDTVCGDSDDLCSTKLTKSAGLLFGTDAVSVLTGSSPSTTPSQHMKSSAHKTSCKSLPTHSRQSSQTSIEIHRDQHKSSVTTKKIASSGSKSSPQHLFGLPLGMSNLPVQDRRHESAGEMKQGYTTGAMGLTNGAMSENPSKGLLIWKPDIPTQSVLKGHKGSQSKKGWSFRKSFGFE